MPVAFAPAAGYTAGSCGTVAVGDVLLNVTDALDASGGVLVVPDHDTLLTLVLDEHPALRRVKVPDHPEVVVDALTDASHAVLREHARTRGLKATGTSDELRAAIRQHDATVAGDTTTAAAVADTEQE